MSSVLADVVVGSVSVPIIVVYRPLSLAVVNGVFLSCKECVYSVIEDIDTPSTPPINHPGPTLLPPLSGLIQQLSACLYKQAAQSDWRPKGEINSYLISFSNNKITKNHIK